jgi:hypothetical protein
MRYAKLDQKSTNGLMEPTASLHAQEHSTLSDDTCSARHYVGLRSIMHISKEKNNKATT